MLLSVFSVLVLLLGSTLAVPKTLKGGKRFPPSQNPAWNSSDIEELSIQTVQLFNFGNDTNESVATTRICINSERCFSGPYKTIRAPPGCPVAVCDQSCSDYRVTDDGCLICRCNGYATREPCNNSTDCQSGSQGCEQGVCRYAAVSESLPQACQYHRECPATSECQDDRCTTSSNRQHLTNESCLFDSQCPNGYYCDEYTCFQGGQDHIEGVPCAFMFQCPSGYFCANATCYTGGPEHGQVPCLFSRTCQDDEVCRGLTCMPKNATQSD